MITNGTAVLGLGDIGPLAGKPVMEGKGVLFQKFAGIDVFDIEIDERDPDKLVDIIASLEPTFGGINLEDIKAPECFIVERKLRERMKIPVFHDDQHGTAIIVGAAVLNALEVVGKNIGSVKLATTGAGAAGIACLDMLVALGVKPENIPAFDRDGVIYTRPRPPGPGQGRATRATPTQRTLAEIVDGADIFLGLSAGGILKPEMVATMADKPIILALANPNPEILPEDAKQVRPDCIIATGRSDYPNQVNNALCFPYIFRGALDVGATGINEAMKLACVRAIAELARIEVVRPRQRLRRRSADLRRRIPDPASVRSAPAGDAGAGRGQGGDGVGRRHASDRGHARLRGEAGPVRLPHRPGDEAGLRPRRAATASAWSTPRARKRPCCARCRR